MKDSNNKIPTGVLSLGALFKDECQGINWDAVVDNKVLKLNRSFDDMVNPFWDMKNNLNEPLKGFDLICEPISQVFTNPEIRALEKERERIYREIVEKRSDSYEKFLKFNITKYSGIECTLELAKRITQASYDRYPGKKFYYLDFHKQGHKFLFSLEWVMGEPYVTDTINSIQSKLKVGTDDPGL